MNDWRKRERERLQWQITDDSYSYTKDGVRRWRSNDAVIQPCTYRDAGLECSPEQQTAHDEETEAFCKAYREAQAAYQPTPEEEAERMFEMRAAFGPGEVVVDVISGKRYQT